MDVYKSYVPHKWWGVFYPATGKRLISYMEYEKLMLWISVGGRFGGSPYVYTNHNKEILGAGHINILDSREFSLKTIQEVSKLFEHFQGTNITHGEVNIKKEVFLMRLGSLRYYYELLGRKNEANEIAGIIESVEEMRASEVTITNEPNLFILDNKIHPNIVCKPVVRRVLSGFVLLNEISREDVLYELTKMMKRFKMPSLTDQLSSL